MLFFLIAASQRAVLQHEQITKRLQVKAFRLRQQQALILPAQVSIHGRKATKIEKKHIWAGRKKYPSFINLKKISSVTSLNWSVAF